MGSLPEDVQYSPSSHHLSILQQVIGTSSVETPLVRSYKRSFNGFAAKLTKAEKQKLASFKEVVSVFPNTFLKLHTTRSWDFMGLKETVDRKLSVESDIVVGVLDTGIWPESDSFKDDGFGPPPKKWKGECKGGANFTCNNKVIGARYYTSETARDDVGHGSHTASTAAGNKVSDASFYGIAKGVARGGVPSARIAVYKICNALLCKAADMLAGFDDAIADGVDIITISAGGDIPLRFEEDSIAIGAFHASAKGILTSQSAGNSGTTIGSTASVVPWVLSVAASTFDRNIVDEVVLGDGRRVVGKSVNSFAGNGTKVPLLYGQQVGDKCFDIEAREAKALITKSEGIQDSLAPKVASFSSRGPNVILPDILKPDVIAPGVEVFAAYSPVASPSPVGVDERRVNYSFIFGTSMSCPHAAGVAAYVKSFHPDWSPSAIKSAIMTTAWPMNGTEQGYAEFEHGSGHINPVKAINPGLVYETSTEDYIKLLCSAGYTNDEIRQISGGNTTCKHGSGEMSPKDLNYPSMSARVPTKKPFNLTFTRTVTNVGLAISSYKAALVSKNTEVTVKVKPEVLSFTTLNEKKTFVVSVTGQGMPDSSVVSASLTWSDGAHLVRSPIVVYTKITKPSLD